MIIKYDGGDDDHAGRIFYERRRKNRFLRITVFMHDTHKERLRAFKGKGREIEPVPAVEVIGLCKYIAVYSVACAAADKGDNGSVPYGAFAHEILYN